MSFLNRKNCPSRPIIIVIILALVNLVVFPPSSCFKDVSSKFLPFESIFYFAFEKDEDNYNTTEENNNNNNNVGVFMSLEAWHKTIQTEVAKQGVVTPQKPLLRVIGSNNNHNGDQSWRAPSSLPKKLYVIYGLESSGTTFMAKTIAGALGLSTHMMSDSSRSRDGKMLVQHISLPLGAQVGFQHQMIHTVPLPVYPVHYPRGCATGQNQMVLPTKRVPPAPCQSFMGTEPIWTYPSRYFVNITSHVRWYRERGVQVQPIMVVRDPSFHFTTILSTHCKFPRPAFVQFEMGREIMKEALLAEDIQPVIVSYESMMQLKKEYLVTIYNQTGIQTNYIPSFQDGNLKYVNYGASKGLSTLYQEILKEEPRKKPTRLSQRKPITDRMYNLQMQQNSKDRARRQKLDALQYRHQRPPLDRPVMGAIERRGGDLGKNSNNNIPRKKNNIGTPKKLPLRHLPPGLGQ